MRGGFDVALALRRTAILFWHDFAPIVVLGFGMILLPEVAQTLIGSGAGATVVATFGGMLRVLFVVIVSFGALARVTGAPLPPDRFASAGLAASPRGLSVALLLGSLVVVVLVALLLAGFAGPSAVVVRGAIVVAAFVAGLPVVAAVPVALVERGSPTATLRRAAALSRGRRDGIAALMVVVALAIVPLRVVLAASVYGPGASAVDVAAIDATMSIASPGLWLLALFDLLAWGAAAVIPAVVYAGLTEA